MSSTGGFDERGKEEEEERGGGGDGPRRGKGILRRIVKRVVNTGKVIVPQVKYMSTLAVI